jgi:hypothetical protein
MDSIVIVVSFILDLIFINDHDKNIPVAIFLFIWQMLRVLSGTCIRSKVPLRVNASAKSAGCVCDPETSIWKHILHVGP